MTEPIRTCVGCGAKRPQRELVRFIAPTGELTLGAKAPGRGVYTCPRQVCFERAQGRRAFSRALGRTVTVPSGLKPFGPEG